jgi:hypothetical protein
MIGVTVQTVRPDKRNDQRYGSPSGRVAEKLCQKAKGELRLQEVYLFKRLKLLLF